MKGSSFVSQVMSHFSKGFEFKFKFDFLRTWLKSVMSSGTCHASDVRVDFPAFFVRRAFSVLFWGELKAKSTEFLRFYIHHTSISKQSSLVDSISTLEQFKLSIKNHN